MDVRDSSEHSTGSSQSDELLKPRFPLHLEAILRA